VRGISAPAQPDQAERRFTTAELETAANRADDDILERLDATDEGQRDLVNLVVNTAAVYLDDPEANLDDAIRASYQLEPREVGTPT
jgi:hypothetical protein